MAMTFRHLALLRFVLDVCQRHNGSVTSWFRTRYHNASLHGSVANSEHLGGYAADVVWDDAAPDLQDLKDPAGIVVVVREGDHDHFQVRRDLL